MFLPVISRNDPKYCDLHPNDTVCIEQNSYNHEFKLWRWVLLGLSLASLLGLLSLLTLCCCARHRRRHGRKPVRGTAWLATPFGNKVNKANNTNYDIPTPQMVGVTRGPTTPTGGSLPARSVIPAV